VWAKKVSDKRTNVSVEKFIDGVEIGVYFLPQDKSGSDLLIAQMAPGVELARAWSWLFCGTWEPGM
jgi:hypothetical protein